MTVFHSIPNTSETVGITIAALPRFDDKTALMRIRVVQRPTQASVDGLRLDRFETGYTYDVSTSLGCLMLSEQWAEPVVSEEPGETSETKSSTDAHEVEAQAQSELPNLFREKCQFHMDSLEYVVASPDPLRQKRRG